MTWTAMSSPTRRAAAAPASVAARTAATSPRTIAVTYPDPIFSHPTRLTLAALTMASQASIMATNPRVSIIPNASPIYGLLTDTARLQSVVHHPDQLFARYVEPVGARHLLGVNRTVR